MQKRRFGRSGHMSTVAIFGAVAFGELEQSEADALMEKIISAGVNHIDVAPSYGEAELRLGPWLAHIRKDFFLGCKTTERSKEGAAAEFKNSLKRLQVEYFDHLFRTRPDFRPWRRFRSRDGSQKSRIDTLRGDNRARYRRPRHLSRSPAALRFRLGAVPNQFCTLRQPGLPQQSSRTAQSLPPARCGYDDHQIHLSPSLGRASAHSAHLV
jgi:hypothetical protein